MIAKPQFNDGAKFFFGDNVYENFDIDFDLVINGISGFAGIKPTFMVVEKEKTLL